MEWTYLENGPGQGAGGKAFRYAVVPDVSASGLEVGVRLTRWPVETRMHDPYQAGAEALRCAVAFPLGRGPGRPGGAPELAALAEVAKGFADAFEAGQDMAGYPAWQHGPALSVTAVEGECGLAGPCTEHGNYACDFIKSAAPDFGVEDILTLDPDAMQAARRELLQERDADDFPRG